MDRVCIPQPYRPPYCPLDNTPQQQQLRVHNSGFNLPGRFADSDPNGGTTCRNTTFGFDKVASAALNIYRDSYQPNTTAGTHEFGAFFSAENFQILRGIVYNKVGDFDESALMERMSFAYSMIKPRSDQMDFERRTVFTPEVTRSYVQELNNFTLRYILPDLIEAKKLQEFYFRNRNGPSELPDIPIADNRAGLASTQAMDYLLPI